MSTLAISLAIILLIILIYKIVNKSTFSNNYTKLEFKSTFSGGPVDVRRYAKRKSENIEEVDDSSRDLLEEMTSKAPFGMTQKRMITYGKFLSDVEQDNPLDDISTPQPRIIREQDI